MALPERTTSEDNIEMQFACNHVSPFLFTNLIVDKMNPDGNARIINVSSLGHQYSPIRFSDHTFSTNKPVPPEETADWDLLTKRGSKMTDSYEPMVAYSQSKTANILFSVGPNGRLQQHGISSFALYPGAVLSEGGKPLLAALPDHVREKFLPSFKTIDQGASTTMVAAFDPDLKPAAGVYLSDCQQVSAAKSWATDPQQAKELWDLSEQLVGQQFQL